MNQKRLSSAKTLLEFVPYFLAVVFLFASLFVMTHLKSYTLSQVQNEVQEDDTISVTALPDKVPYITDVRILSEHGSGLGIFDSDGELLEVVEFDLLSLSASDRQLIKKGLAFDSEGEMRDFLESLDS